MNASNGRETGTVKWFSREKGWGFVRRANGDEIFVHHSDILGDGHVSLEDDEEVEFAVEEMEKGPRARDVRRVANVRRGGGDVTRDTSAAPAGSAPPSASIPSTAPPVRGESPRDRPVPSRTAAETPSDHVEDMLRRRLADRFPGLFDR